jgi:hypothetical protein
MAGEEVLQVNGRVLPLNVDDTHNTPLLQEILKLSLHLSTLPLIFTSNKIYHGMRNLSRFISLPEREI